MIGINRTLKKNIILLTIDCLRADYLSCLGCSNKNSPNLDKVASNGILFTNAISNGANTLLSVPSFLTSTYPPVCNRKIRTITEILKSNGFSTAAFNPNPITFLKMGGVRCIGINRGFETYEMMLSNKNKIKLYVGFLRMILLKIFLRKIFEKEGLFYQLFYNIYEKVVKINPLFFTPKEHFNIPTAEDLNNEAMKWIENQKKNYFLWIHYMDLHEPYANPSNFDKKTLYLLSKYRDFPDKLTKIEIEELKNLYRKQIKYVDRVIGIFLKTLKNKNLNENNVVIITADHGDAFGEHGTLGHGGKFPSNVYDEIIHVPLIIYGLTKNKVITRQVQLLDLAPTICELMGVQQSDDFIGKTLFNKCARNVVSISGKSYSYRTEKYKIIVDKKDNKKISMFCINDDPGEKIDIFNENQEIALSLYSEMKKILEKAYKN